MSCTDTFLTDSGVARREGAVDMLQPVCHANARGVANQEPAEAMVRPEHSNAVAEEGCCNRDPMRRGVFQPHRVSQGRVYRGGG